MLISESYRKLNARLHEDRPDYGTSGQRYAEPVRSLIKRYGPDVLDYGCGKRTLEQSLGLSIRNYDPAIPEYAATPEPAAIVVCTDVLEHIEPDNLNDVLADIRRCTLQVAFLTIATRPAKKTLADGRNAHLIQHGSEWWLPKLWEAGFRLRQFVDVDLEMHLIVEPK